LIAFALKKNRTDLRDQVLQAAKSDNLLNLTQIGQLAKVTESKKEHNASTGSGPQIAVAGPKTPTKNDGVALPPPLPAKHIRSPTDKPHVRSVRGRHQSHFDAPIRPPLTYPPSMAMTMKSALKAARTHPVVGPPPDFNVGLFVRQAKEAMSGKAPKSSTVATSSNTPSSTNNVRTGTQKTASHLNSKIATVARDDEPTTSRQREARSLVKRAALQEERRRDRSRANTNVENTPMSAASRILNVVLTPSPPAYVASQASYDTSPNALYGTTDSALPKSSTSTSA